jgi:hypothetical protein
MEVLIASGAALMGGATAAGSTIAGASATLGSALGLGGTAAGATGAAATAGGAAAGSSSALALLQGGANALSAFGTLASGLATKRASDQRAADEEVAARQEQIIGLQEGNDILDNAISTLARQRITIGASGVDAFSGTAEGRIREGVSDTEENLRLTGDNASIRALRRRRTARSLRRSGRAGLIGAGFQAGAQGLNAAAKFREVA